MKPIEQPVAVSDPHDHAEIDLDKFELIKEHLQRAYRGVTSGQASMEWTLKANLIVADCLRQRPDADAEMWKAACRRCIANQQSRHGAKLPSALAWLPRLVLFLPKLPNAPEVQP